MQIIKRITKRTALFAVIIALCAALVLGAFAFTRHKRASADGQVEDFKPVSLGISNPDFSETSGSYPASPSSWTGANVGSGSGDIVSGVLDLTPDVYDSADAGNKKYKLDGDEYPEYKNDIPRTIFGDGEFGGNAKALFINAAGGAEVAYAYKSSEMTFDANSFYSVSVWVKTGNFATDTGATVRLTGLGETCKFANINTVKNLTENGVPKLDKQNRYGWVKYTFYVRTSASLSKTVTLSLGIGDAITDDDKDIDVMPRYASGYAFFDTVEAHKISAYDFAFKTLALKSTDRADLYMSDDGTTLALDLYDTEYLKAEGGSEIGTFSDCTPDLKGSNWDINAVYDPDAETHGYTGKSSVRVYDSQSKFDEDNAFGFTEAPRSPLGKAEYETSSEFFSGTNGNILAITATDGTAARGVASPDYTIERFKYYRFGVWVKGDGIDGGNGISIGVKGGAPNGKLNQWYTSLEGNAEDEAHYGWKEQVVYIKGSALGDYDVHFELWLGAPDAMSSGVAMFDDVTFTELAYSDYSAMSAADGGNVLSLDTASTDTGITNGNFANVGDYDEYKFPLPVADWTFYDASNVGTTGFSDNAVKTDSVINGIIPIDDATFAELKSDGVIPNISNPKYFSGAPLYNAAILSSGEQTAVCYRSPAITAAVDKGYKILAEIAVDGVSENGYGASLVLKTEDGSVVSTVEGIKNTGRAFKTYTFYLDAPLSEQKLNLEIWLGLNDRKDNTQKLSDGNVYIKRAAVEEWTAPEGSTVADEYKTVFEKYLSDITDKNKLGAMDYGVYSFDDPSLDYFDAYTYNADPDAFGTLYNWNVTSANGSYRGGIFDASNMKNLRIYNGFDPKDYDGKMLFINNTAPDHTMFTYGNTLSLVANTYYRLDVTVKVRVTDEVRKDKTHIGAGINLTGTVTESFENIKDTTDLISEGNEDSRDYEAFKTYTFFISSGSNGGDVGLNITFGGDNRTSYIQGQLIVADVSLTSINNTDYENAEKNLSDHQKAVALSETTNTDDDTNTEAPTNDVAWWIIPTVIFSALLVAAIILIVVVRIRDKVKKNKKTTYTSEHDRSKVIKELDKLAEAEKADNNTEADKADAPYADTDDGAVDTTDDAAPATDDNAAEPETNDEPPAETEKAEKKDDGEQDLDD